MRSGGRVITEFSLPSGPDEQCWEIPSCSTFANHGSGLKPPIRRPYFEGGARVLYLSLIWLPLLQSPHFDRGREYIVAGGGFMNTLRDRFGQTRAG